MYIKEVSQNNPKLKLHSFFPGLTMSSTASVQSSADQAPAAEPAQPVDEFGEYGDAETNFQPKSLKFWTIIIGMYLSIFLVALVSSTARPCLQH
jgi:hypothetical protein